MSQNDACPVIFGEVLFDQFEDGSVVLGGAPFNVAWYLQGFGLNPLFISRIGNDEPGKMILERMREWGMDTDGVQMDDSKPTGTVQVTIKDEQPNFTILGEQAYDFIQQQKASFALKDRHVSLIYFGSLIARSAVSRKTLLFLLQDGTLPAFVDINLRPPWWTLKAVQTILNRACWAKLNDRELAEILQKPIGDLDIRKEASYLCECFKLKLVVVTMGEKGAYFVTENDVIRESPVVVNEIVDTVGAGDSFSAVTILGLIRGWPLHLTLKRAILFSAEVCKMRGATARDHRLCRYFIKDWT